MVGGTWIEHVTSSVSRKRSPTELTALSLISKRQSIFYGSPSALLIRVFACKIALTSLRLHGTVVRTVTVLHAAKGGTMNRVCWNATIAPQCGSVSMLWTFVLR
jgi:hypothetical protein